MSLPLLSFSYPEPDPRALHDARRIMVHVERTYAAAADYSVYTHTACILLLRIRNIAKSIISDLEYPEDDGTIHGVWSQCATLKEMSTDPEIAPLGDAAMRQLALMRQCAGKVQAHIERIRDRRRGDA